MTPAETVKVLREFNAWRRGGDGDQPHPKQIGEAIDAACEMIERIDRLDVPEDVMRDAERYRYLRARDDGTAGVGCWIETDGRACDRGWLCGVQLDSAIDSFIEVLAAAPEAKP